MRTLHRATRRLSFRRMFGNPRGRGATPGFEAMDAPAIRIERHFSEWSVTSGTCNGILSALFVLATKQRRDAVSDVWMTRTRSAIYRTFVVPLSLRPATLA